MTTLALPAISEAEFQRQVTALADLFGWAHYHTHDSRRSNAGFPDLILVKGPVLLAWELKAERGAVKPEQRKWIERLAAAGVRAAVMRPKDWPEIERVLTGEPPPPSAAAPRPAGG